MKQTYSLSELCNLISSTLQDGMPNTYWVTAEIVSMAMKGGHCYLELAEKNEGNGLFAAKIRATCWQNVFSMLSSFFSTETGETLHVGLRILAETEVRFHAAYGLSLNIVGIDPTYTVGSLHKQKEETLRRLQKEGILQMQQLLPLPSLLKRIAVISAPDAAGYGDFCDQLTTNQLGFQFTTSLFPALMQGEKAPESIINALDAVYNSRQDFDTVVIIRGGGANTDLSCFDDYLLAATCAQFPLPVLTGIGHQRDVSVLDQVAHTALKTPTAVAEFLIDQLAAQADKINNLQLRLRQSLERTIVVQQHQLQQIQLTLYANIKGQINQYKDQLNSYEKIIRLLSPESLYKKGYTLTLVQGKRINSVKNIRKGDVLLTEFTDGKIESRVL